MSLQKEVDAKDKVEVRKKVHLKNSQVQQQDIKRNICLIKQEIETIKQQINDTTKIIEKQCDKNKQLENTLHQEEDKLKHIHKI